MKELHVPGVALVAIRDARVVWRRNFGFRDQASGEPVDDGTTFEAQSMSKPVFAYRVMKLCEEGKLDLDAPLTKYTPDVFVKGDQRLERVTARRVLSHATGSPNMRSKETPLRFEFTPGEGWAYSGEAYHYLQSTVTRLAGRFDENACGTYEQGYRVCASDFDVDMKTNLLEPFGMRSSGYVWSEWMDRKMATPHDHDGKPMKRRRSSAIDVARYGSLGSLLTTAGDFALFLLEVMRPKRSDSYRLNAASWKEMLRPQVKVPKFPMPCSWALGWQIWHLEKGDVVAHGGDFDGVHSQAVFSTERKSGFVILTNGERGGEMIWDRMLQELVVRLVL
ncbi:MAG: serine hydrolase [Bryobacterales bacterium]|nr:serine hydrolase [Bryobacterales bacterium]